MDAQELQRLQYEQQKAINDMLVYGTGFTVGGKHVPTETVMMFSNPEVTSTTPAAPVAERAVSPAESVLPPLPKPSGDWEGVDGWDEDAMRDYALAAHAEGRRSAMEELVELKREKERRDRIVQRAIARLNAAEVEEPSVIGAGFADPALPIEELHPQWLKEKERADRAEAAIAAAREESYAAGRRNGARDERISSKAEAEEAAALAARQAPDADDLVRYTPAIDQAHGIAYALKSPKGSFVLFADVQALLAQPLQQEGGKDVSEEMEDPILIPRGLIGAACYLIRKHAPDGKLLGKLREYTTGARSGYVAPQPSGNLQQSSTAQVEPAKAAHMFEKFCSYCQKYGHTDAECWCTRAVNQPSEPPLTMSMFASLEELNAAKAARASQATPEGAELPEKLKTIIELYADSYRSMSKMGDGKVDAGNVEYDMTANIIPQVMKAACTALAASQQAAEPVCATCKGVGMVGGPVGQTPESFDYVSEDCPDCTPSKAAQKGAQDLRHDFEMWKSRRGEAAIYAGDGQYESSIVQGEWEAWCDSAALYRAAPPQQVDTGGLPG